MTFEEAEWIWLSNSLHDINEYAEFITDFFLNDTKNTEIRICAKSDYAFYINGKIIGFNQFHDFPDEKVYDEYALKGFTKKGENYLAILSLAKNYESSSHIANGKGIIFEIISDGNIILSSGEKVLSRLSKTYKSGDIQNITSQLGKTFFYDFTVSDKWINKKIEGFQESKICDKKTKFIARPIDKLDISNVKNFEEIKSGIYDIGSESSGYLGFDIESHEDILLSVSYGEHINDGNVRKNIHDRKFTVFFNLKKGRNVLDCYFLRLGLRYLMIDSNLSKINIHKLYIKEALYPVNIKPYKGKAISKDIYDVSVNTLRNCMHEHYEDCPWREQAQYTMDSRTQMLCGYYAFDEKKLPSSALRQMSHRLTGKGVLPITSPSVTELSIPNFSLIFPLMLKEYFEFTKDRQLIDELFEKCQTVIQHYINSMNNMLLPMQNEWNFFEWENGLANEEEIFKQNKYFDKYALPENAFFIVALESFAILCKICGKEYSKYTELSKQIKEKARETFFDTETGLFATYNTRGEQSNFSELSQVMALYSEIAFKDDKDKILNEITGNHTLIPLTLSNHIFKYEVLIKEGGFEDYIIKDINDKWGYMLNCGATAFWETIKGAEDFGGAGSLCHGWSAVPVYVAWNLK